jgi:hypothetical protein
MLNNVSRTLTHNVRRQNRRRLTLEEAEAHRREYTYALVESRAFPAAIHLDMIWCIVRP